MTISDVMEAKRLARQSDRKKALVVLSGGNIDQAKMLKIWSTIALSGTHRSSRRSPSRLSLPSPDFVEIPARQW
jgi:threonine dehydratase